jgi:hypothetical protein
MIMKKDLSGEGFPCDLDYLAFFERCQEVYDTMILVLKERYRECNQLSVDRVVMFGGPQKAGDNTSIVDLERKKRGTIEVENMAGLQQF